MKGEEVPTGERFSLTLSWTWAQMLQARDFEGLVDGMLADAKRQIMQKYRDMQGPPRFFPADEGRPEDD